jgi:hypothetical protein
MRAVMRRSDRKLSADFARRFSASDRGEVRCVGVEHEYVVEDDGIPVDFERVLDHIEPPGEILHPTDPTVHLTLRGTAIIGEGRLAEVATPPVQVQPGHSQTVAAWARTGRDQLRDSLPSRLDVSGYSTHLNVGVDPDLNDETCHLLAKRFSAPSMLLMDRSTSPGLLIRPRPGRVELGGEFIDGVALRAATVFSVGSVLAAEQAARSRDHSSLPPELDVALEPARRRHGWYVDRDAFGVDLYERGRSAQLRGADGAAIEAQDQLTAAWACARPHARRVASDAELAIVDRVVEGIAPIPLEDPQAAVISDACPAVGDDVLGLALQTRARRGLAVRPLNATWDWVAFWVGTPDKSAVVNVPRRHLRTFLDELDRGRLDQLLLRYIERSRGGRILKLEAQTGQPGIYDSLRAGPALLAEDRYGAGNGDPSRARHGKLGVPLISIGSTPPTGEPSRMSRFGPILAALGGLAALGVILLIALNGGEKNATSSDSSVGLAGQTEQPASATNPPANEPPPPTEASETLPEGAGTYVISSNYSGPCGTYEVFLRVTLFANGEMTVDQLDTAGGNAFQSARGQWNSETGVATLYETTLFEIWFFSSLLSGSPIIYNVYGPSSSLVGPGDGVDLSQYSGVTSIDELASRADGGPSACAGELAVVDLLYSSFPSSVSPGATAAPTSEESESASLADPRVRPRLMEALIDANGQVWIHILFNGSWIEIPPRDFFSMFWRFLVTYNPTVEIGWQTHDGVETVLGTTSEAYILDDGGVLLATGLFPTRPFELDIVASFGSWKDEAGPPAIFGEESISIDSDSIEAGDPLVDFGGKPVFDLVAGE